MRTTFHTFAIVPLLVSAISLAGYEYVLEHDRPARIEGAYTLYHKGYGATVYVTNSDQLLYWALSMACIASALFLAFRALGRVSR